MNADAAPMIETVIQFARRHPSIRRVELFGSRARRDARAESDLDLLLSLDPEADLSLFDLGEWQVQLAELLGRPVDLLTRRSVEQSSNPIRRECILKDAVLIYEHES